MILDTIRRHLKARAPLVYLITEEEDRVERLIASALRESGDNAAALYTWSCVSGLRKAKDRVENSSDPVMALSLFLQVKGPAILIFKDLHLFIDGRPALIRELKECARFLRSSPKKIFFLCPHLNLPPELFPLVKIDDIPLPGYEELSRILDTCIAERPDADALRKSVAPDIRDKLVRAAMGFSANEAADAFHGAIDGSPAIDGNAVDLVLEEKGALVRKSGVLEFVSTLAGTWEIGGLTNLKKWLKERGDAFSPAAAKHGLTPPKGILVMGVSGCGKSLCVKAIAAYWKLPLLRLDMGKVYDGLAGPPEEAMRKAIKTAEAIAPCVLWIDEIEAGIANQQQKQAGGHEARVLALFLTWMQEKTSPVFVGATANEVEVLPPELMRKGRFDEMFYMGLPSAEERKQILSIHMRKRKLDPAKFDMDYLARSTESFNGAEIEQGVISAMFESRSRKAELSEHILANCFRNIVPLSRTMRERIQKIEAWARDRAMKASLETL